MNRIKGISYLKTLLPIMLCLTALGGVRSYAETIVPEYAGIRMGKENNQTYILIGFKFKTPEPGWTYPSQADIEIKVRGIVLSEYTNNDGTYYCWLPESGPSSYGIITVTFRGSNVPFQDVSGAIIQPCIHAWPVHIVARCTNLKYANLKAKVELNILYRQLGTTDRIDFQEYSDYSVKYKATASGTARYSSKRNISWLSYRRRTAKASHPATYENNRILIDFQPGRYFLQQKIGSAYAKKKNMPYIGDARDELVLKLGPRFSILAGTTEFIKTKNYMWQIGWDSAPDLALQ